MFLEPSQCILFLLLSVLSKLKVSEWVRYGCEETALQSLPMLLDGTLPGAPFDAAAERTAYSTVAANIGTCGDIVYEQIKNALIEKGSH